ncbi:cytochrome C [Romeria aff. gracilis LEGE 07310]|uniref:Cytochrome C n=1 Tax=Vasconcelosia minhoensis LEGE 07310 TaxID=915328 RepID=A0A8J7DF48_9CYAN|nr:diheme cytochrome c [Romeria gracilis]MBE9080423.1 cytochrome C [Romeria aff. gracilis LEGE 07310]
MQWGWRFWQRCRKGRLFRLGIVAGLIGVWSIALGWGLAQAVEPPDGLNESPIGMVDPVAPDYAVGYRLYVENCSTCHVALPPAVLPTETWQQVLGDTAHYGVMLEPLWRFDRQAIVRYLRTYSRPNRPSEDLPYRVAESDYFYALHPQMELPQPVRVSSCASCHLGAENQNFGSWEAQTQVIP